MATYKVQLADDVDGELQEPLPIVKQGGLIGLKRSNMEYGLYHGNLPNTKKRRYLIAERGNPGEKIILAGSNFGEASKQTVPSACKYLLGVRSKSTRTLQVYRSQLFNVRPILEDEEIADVNKDKTFMEKVVQITESFGSEKKKRAVVTIQRNRLDSSMLNETIVPAIQHAENQSKSEADNVVMDTLHIPPCNKEAEKASDVYKLADIVSDSELEALNELAQTALSQVYKEAKEWKKEKKYPDVVISQLKLLAGSSRKLNQLHKARCLLYSSCLMHLYKLDGKDLRNKGPQFSDDIPLTVRESILSKYTTTAPGKNKKISMSKQQRDRVLNYLLVLLLIIFEYTFDFSLLMSDLKVTQHKLKLHLKALGCSVASRRGASSDTMQPCTAILSIPLDFPKPQHKKPKGN